MKDSKIERMICLAGAVFLSFWAGWFLRGARSASDQVLVVELSRGRAELSAPAGDLPDPSLSSPGEKPGEDQKVNLNTASREELERLPGIGEKRAAEIIADREKNGPFARVEDLTRVNGIGKRVLEGLRDYVTVSEEVASTPPAYVS